MSTLIYIKKRAEPIKLSWERGAVVKQLWFDEKTPRDTLIDLGEWSGELREIRTIEQEPEVKSSGSNSIENLQAEEEKNKEDIETFRKLPPEEKVKRLKPWLLTSFEVRYKFATDGENPTEKALWLFGLDIQSYFVKNPDATTMPIENIKESVSKIVAHTIK